jgi:hypothetical protein
LALGSEENKVERFIWWEPPPMGWVRLNTDGSCRENGFIGCGGIIRGNKVLQNLLDKVMRI